MAFDADTHTAHDAPAARQALNAAILETRSAFTALITAQQAVERLRSVAFGYPEAAQIIAIRNALRRAELDWPAELHQDTDLERARAEEVSRATTAHLTALHHAGELSTVGD